MKVGDEFYAAWADAAEGRVLLDLWVISSIAAGKVHAIRKNEYTWIKRSTKTGDYGWSKNLGPYDRKAFRLEGGPPAEWAQTKAAAFTKALPEIDAAIKSLTKLRAQILGRRTKARAKGVTRKGTKSRNSPEAKTAVA